jgi:hypothetical protein
MQSQTRRNQTYRDNIKAWFHQYRQTLSCEQCGESHVATIAFHHRDPSTKKYRVADMPNRGCSIRLILEEIDKCDVLCHNCHARLHYEEGERPFMVRRRTT